MNPLGVSVVFVICSIMLSFLKHIFFSPAEPTASDAKFHKVFQLANNKIQDQPTYYKSLYQAYYKLQMDDIDKYSSALYGKAEFNENILMNPLNKWEMSFICPSDFIILAVSGVTINESGLAKSTNSFYIYKLPLMSKIGEISIDGRIFLSKQCKKERSKNKYELKFISKSGPAIISVDQYEKITVQYMNQNKIPNKYFGTEAFDFDHNCLAYWQKQQLWAIKIQLYAYGNFHNGSNSLQNSTFQDEIKKQSKNVQINILSIEVEENKSYNETQSLNVHQIAVVSKKQGSYVTIVYDYHSLNSANKSVMVSSFLVTPQHTKLLTRILIHIDNVNTNPISLACSHYLNPQNSTQDLSCLLHRENDGKTQFINVFDIFNQTTVAKQNKQIKQQKQSVFDADAYTNFLDQQLSTFYLYEEDDISWIMESMPEQKQQAQPQAHHYHWKILNFAFEISSRSTMKIIKPSLPDPIIYYRKGEEHILFSFNVRLTEEEEDGSIEISYFSIAPPTFEQEEDKYLREIFWSEDENLIVVVWNGAIEAYQYQLYEFPQNSSDGVSMSVIFPFIELFATVFCLMRIVWSSD